MAALQVCQTPVRLVSITSCQVVSSRTRLLISASASCREAGQRVLIGNPYGTPSRDY
jgi:hypothetical protein